MKGRKYRYRRPIASSARKGPCMRRRVTSIGLLVTTAVVIAAMSAPVGAGAQQQYPVPYTFLANIVAEATSPGSPPPGANNWSCTPTSAHPHPLVLVHG